MTFKPGPRTHLHEELAQSTELVSVQTHHGAIRGRRATNGAAVFLEVPYALPPERFTDPVPFPTNWVYEDKEYIFESTYAFQPNNDGQSAATPFEDKVGLGKPSENPLFVNIHAPPSFPEKTGFPVKVYIHGGFLQFGSPHGLKSQAQYIAAERNEVWVNIGYRLSAFGFLASDQPKIDGNFGFKDQWLALQWIHANISAFGGDPQDVTLTGLSAGSHSVHQLLHHASRLPAGVASPFQRAQLQSNAIVTTPKTPAELRPQYEALCRALGLDPAAPDTLAALRDPARVSAAEIARVIETDALGAVHGTFRGCFEPLWFGHGSGATGDDAELDPMAWQRSGGLARGLAAHGVKSVVLGEVSEEWYLYSIAHPVESMRDVEIGLERYYRKGVVRKMLDMYLGGKEGGVGEGREEVEKAFGELLSEGQVYLPARMFARDMLAAGFPLVRYDIRWAPEQLRPLGYVTHATDRALWAFRLPSLEGGQVDIARAWLDAVDEHVKNAEAGQVMDLKSVLVLSEDKKIVDAEDVKWDTYMRLRTTLPDEI